MLGSRDATVLPPGPPKWPVSICVEAGVTAGPSNASEARGHAEKACSSRRNLGEHVSAKQSDFGGGRGTCSRSKSMRAWIPRQISAAASTRHLDAPDCFPEAKLTHHAGAQWMRAGNACTRTSIVLRAPPAVPKPVAQVTFESSEIDDHWLLPMCTLLALEDEQQQKPKERGAFESPGHFSRDSPILFREDCSLEVPPMDDAPLVATEHRRADVHLNPTTPGGPQTPSPGPASANWGGEDGAVQCRFGPQTPTSPQRLGPGVLLQLDQLFEQAFAFRAWKCVTTRQQHSCLTRGRKQVSGRTLIDRDGVCQNLRQAVATWQHAIRARAQMRANLQRASNYVRLCGLRLGFRTMRRHVIARNAERLKHSLARRRSRTRLLGRVFSILCDPGPAHGDSEVEGNIPSPAELMEEMCGLRSKNKELKSLVLRHITLSNSQEGLIARLEDRIASSQAENTTLIATVTQLQAEISTYMRLLARGAPPVYGRPLQDSPAAPNPATQARLSTFSVNSTITPDDSASQCRGHSQLLSSTNKTAGAGEPSDCSLPSRTREQQIRAEMTQHIANKLAGKRNMASSPPSSCVLSASWHPPFVTSPTVPTPSSTLCTHGQSSSSRAKGSRDRAVRQLPPLGEGSGDNKRACAAPW